MNGIHEVTGSIPVWSTILRSPSASFGWHPSQFVRPGPCAIAKRKDAALSEALEDIGQHHHASPNGNQVPNEKRPKS
jgi:hypothetical protein